MLSRLLRKSFPVKTSGRNTPISSYIADDDDGGRECPDSLEPEEMIADFLHVQFPGDITLSGRSTPVEKVSGDNTPYKQQARMAALPNMKLSKILLSTGGSCSPCTPLTTEAVTLTTVGHQKAIKVSEYGRDFYCKKTTLEEKKFSGSGAKVYNQHFESLLHRIQKKLFPEPEKYLKFFPRGKSKFLSEWREGAINLTDAIKDPNFNPGKITGLATALMVKMLLRDGDNKFDNILIVPDSSDPTRYLAFGIDGEKIMQDFKLEAVQVTNIDELIGNIREIKYMRIRDVSVVRERIQGWIDPVEIRNFPSKIGENYADLVNIIDKCFSQAPGLSRNDYDNLYQSVIGNIEEMITPLSKSQSKSQNAVEGVHVKRVVHTGALPPLSNYKHALTGGMSGVR